MTTSANQILSTLESRASISLPDLQLTATFLTRRDRKYLVPIAMLPELLTHIEPGTRVLEIDGRRRFHYLTPYFDTTRWDAYTSALRRRPNRFKVRTRLYVDSGLCLLEAKFRDGRGLTVKQRMHHDPATLFSLADPELDWLAAFPQVREHAHHLRHCLTTSYHRITLALPHATARVTLDTDLAFSQPTGQDLAIPQHVVVETKGAGQPTSVDRLLWRAGIRPVSISKFACGLSLLHPELPANRWTRIRTRLTPPS